MKNLEAVLLFLIVGIILTCSVYAVRDICELWEPDISVHEYNVTHYTPEEIEILEELSMRGY